MDYIVRYGPNKAAFYSYQSYQEIIDQILKTVIEMGKGIELNTAGFRKGIGQPNPSGDIIKRYRELGGEIITVGFRCSHPRRLRAVIFRLEWSC